LVLFRRYVMEGLSIVPQIIILVLLLVCSAFFSGSETALMAVSRLRLKQLEKKNRSAVQIANRVLEKPEKLISTILLGNNLVNVAMSAIATAIAISIWGDSGIIYITIILTLVILVFAEITPKVYAKYHNDRISLMTAPVIRIIMVIFHPFVVIFTFIARYILLALGIDISKVKRTLVTEAEVKSVIQIGWEDGSITAEEKRLLSRVFTMNDVSVRDIMIPENRMVTLDDDTPIKQVLRTIRKTGFSRYPVSRGKSGEIIGFLHAKDLLGKSGTKRMGSLKKVIRPAYFIPDDKKIDVQLRAFKARKLHQAVVLDKEGEVAGLITLEDILEQMVGSIEDEYDAALL
jgi:putative hemolysin